MILLGLYVPKARSQRRCAERSLCGFVVLVVGTELKLHRAWLGAKINPPCEFSNERLMNVYVSYAARLGMKNSS